MELEKFLIFGSIAIIVATLNYTRQLQTALISSLSFRQFWVKIKSLSVLANIVFFLRFVAIICFTGVVGIIMAKSSLIVMGWIPQPEIVFFSIPIHLVEFIFSAIGGFLGAESLERLSNKLGFGTAEQKEISTTRVNERLENGNANPEDEN